MRPKVIVMPHNRGSGDNQYASTKSNVLKLDMHQLHCSSEVLQLLFYRNKNQHRHSKWWGSFCALKRCVAELVNEVQRHDQNRAVGRCNMLEDFLLLECYE